MDGDGKSDFVIVQGDNGSIVTILSSQLAASDAADGTTDRSISTGNASGVTSVSTEIVGTAGNDLLSGGSGVNVIRGTGGADYIVAGAGDDTVILNASNVTSMSQTGAYIDGGTGTDTLRLEGSGMTLNLTTLPGKVSGIEKIDLTGSGNNTLRLGLSDVLAVSETDQLYVTGNSGDVVQVVGSSVTASPQSVGGISYNAYNLNGTGLADLLVQQGVTVAFVA